jgi:hypothetical protein
LESTSDITPRIIIGITIRTQGKQTPFIIVMTLDARNPNKLSIRNLFTRALHNKAAIDDREEGG